MMSRISSISHTVRFLLSALVLAVGLMLGLPQVTTAHGAGLEATVNFRPAPPVAGQAISFEVELTYADDNDRLSAASIFVSAVGPANETISAVPLDPTGDRWTGELTLPTEGLWTVQIQVDLPGGSGEGRYNVQVAPAGTAPSGEVGEFGLEMTLTPYEESSQPLWLEYWPLLVGSLIVVATVLAFRFLPPAESDDPEFSS